MRRLTSCLGGASAPVGDGTTNWMVDPTVDECQGSAWGDDADGSESGAWGFMSTTSSLQKLYSQLVEACPGTGEMCLGGEEWTQCAVGHKPGSPLCAVCAEGYIQGSDWMCTLCPKNSGWSLVGVLLLLTLVLLAVFILWQQVGAVLSTLYFKLHVYKEFLQSLGVEVDDKGYMTEGSKQKAYVLVSKRASRRLAQQERQRLAQTEDELDHDGDRGEEHESQGGAYGTGDRVSAARTAANEDGDADDNAAHRGRGIRQKAKILVVSRAALLLLLLCTLLLRASALVTTVPTTSA